MLGSFERLSQEYYIVDNKEKREMQVCRYNIDCFHPYGDDIVVTSRSYGKDSPFTKGEATEYTNKMCMKFNGKRFRNERPVYYDH